MNKIISFIRINKNNEEYTQNQAIGIAKYLHNNNLQLHNNIEIELTTPEDEEKISTLLLDCKSDCTILIYDLNVFGRTISSILDMLKNLLNLEQEL